MTRRQAVKRCEGDCSLLENLRIWKSQMTNTFWAQGLLERKDLVYVR